MKVQRDEATIRGPSTGRDITGLESRSLPPAQHTPILPEVSWGSSQVKVHVTPAPKPPCPEAGPHGRRTSKWWAGRSLDRAWNPGAASAIPPGHPSPWQGLWNLSLSAHPGSGAKPCFSKAEKPAAGWLQTARLQMNSANWHHHAQHPGQDHPPHLLSSL